MAKHQWTDIEIFDCDVAGFRVAMALAISAGADPGEDPEPANPCGVLKHCTGVSRCGFNLPASIDQSALANCPMAKFLRYALAGTHGSGLPVPNTGRIRGRLN